MHGLQPFVSKINHIPVTRTLIVMYSTNMP
jgi:hypothetical protein